MIFFFLNYKEKSAVHGYFCREPGLLCTGNAPGLAASIGGSRVPSLPAFRGIPAGGTAGSLGSLVAEPLIPSSLLLL